MFAARVCWDGGTRGGRGGDNVVGGSRRNLLVKMADEAQIVFSFLRFLCPTSTCESKSQMEKFIIWGKVLPLETGVSTSTKDTFLSAE